MSFLLAPVVSGADFDLEATGFSVEVSEGSSEAIGFSLGCQSKRAGSAHIDPETGPNSTYCRNRVGNLCKICRMAAIFRRGGQDTLIPFYHPFQAEVAADFRHSGLDHAQVRSTVSGSFDE